MGMGVKILIYADRSCAKLSHLDFSLVLALSKHTSIQAYKHTLIIIEPVSTLVRESCA